MNILSPGTRIGQYEIASRPMMGGMGVVYFALDHGNDGHPVAIKTFRPELLPDRAARDRFLREGTAWIELGSHPHIVRCYKVEYIDPTAFLVLELIAKEQNMPDASLRSWLIPGQPLPIEQALLFALQIARGMQYAGEKIPGFVHRDLKPENILIGADRLPGTNLNHLRVTDFGLAAILESENPSAVEKKKIWQERDFNGINRLNMVSVGGILGTPEYMAPEQWVKGLTDHRADMYSLGCILLEMLSGQTPVKANPRVACRELHHRGEALRKASAVRDVSLGTGFSLEKCLAVDPAQRYANWSNLVTGLEKAYAGYKGLLVPKVPVPDMSGNTEQMQTGWSYSAMGIAYFDMGKMHNAMNYFNQSLKIFRETGDRFGEGASLGNLGMAYQYQGNIHQAIGYYEQTLEIMRDYGNRRVEGIVLNNLGTAYASLDDEQRALLFFEQFLATSREIGDKYAECTSLASSCWKIHV
jgi:serine/threonine protein kinase